MEGNAHVLSDTLLGTLHTLLFTSCEKPIKYKLVSQCYVWENRSSEWWSYLRNLVAETGLEFFCL